MRELKVTMAVVGEFLTRNVAAFSVYIFPLLHNHNDQQS